MISHRIIEIRKQFDTAELALKKFERIGLVSLASALNELRYAGQHIVAAETAGNETDSDEHCQRALRHCVRAEFDAKEASILALLKWFARYQHYELTADEMTVFVPGWRDILKRADAARNLLENAGHARNEDVAAMDAAIDALMSARDAVLRALPQINAKRKAVLDANEKMKRDLEYRKARETDSIRRENAVFEARQFLVSFNATVGGTFIGLLGTLIAIACAFPQYRVSGIVIGLILFALVSACVYSWSKKRLISETTLQMLEEDILPEIKENDHE